MSRLTDAARTAAYQSTVALGIVLLPVAVAASRLGLTLPFHRLLRQVDAGSHT